MKLVLSCEHGGNDLPAELAALFSGQAALLESHRGFDRGAESLYARFQSAASYSAINRISRLVVDFNRSPHHRSLFSTVTRALPRQTREQLLTATYRPYRDAVERAIAALIDDGATVLHLSVHSFTLVLNGERRNADVGLLYDPQRSLERRLATAWRSEVITRCPTTRVRMNYPYRGVADGFTRALRQRFADAHYAGIELELNQGLLTPADTFPQPLVDALDQSLRQLLDS